MIGYHHAPRVGGGSAWNTTGPWRPGIDGASPSATRPLRRAAAIVAVTAAGAGLLALLIATNALLPGDVAQGHPWRTGLANLVGWLQRRDEQLFLFLNSLGSQRWDGLWLFVTGKFSWTPFYLALMYLVYRHFGWKNMLVIVALIVVMVTATDQLSNLFKQGFERLRPCREEHLRELIRYVAPRCGRHGYFSAHAANSMAFAVFMGLLLRKHHRYLPTVLLAWAASVGFSRIYVGVHYPLDTLTGLVIGALAGVLAWRIHRVARHAGGCSVFPRQAGFRRRSAARVEPLDASH